MNLLTIKNQHTSKNIPSWLNEKRNVSYFTGTYGDQWVSLITETEVKIACGDNEWKSEVFHRNDGPPQLSSVNIPGAGSIHSIGETIVGEAEAFWIKSVFALAKELWK